MIDFLIGILGLIFVACEGILYIVGIIFGITYGEAATVVNLYVQPIILIISSLFVLYSSIKTFKIKKLWRAIYGVTHSALYVCTYLLGFRWLFVHYGMGHLQEAYNSCLTELLKVAEVISFDELEGCWYYVPQQTEYMAINVFLFIGVFLLCIVLNKNLYKNNMSKLKAASTTQPTIHSELPTAPTNETAKQ